MLHKTVQFGSFTVDLERQRLVGVSGPLELRPKCFDALRYLVEHAGSVVSKDELLDAVWPHVTVSEESLTQCISEIRRAIGDERRQIIRTISRRGYLFDTPVCVGPANALQPGAGDVHAASGTTGSRPVRWTLLPVTATALVAIAVLVGVTKPQDIQGSWRGFLNCEKLPVTTKPLLGAPFELTVSGNRAMYTRKVYTADGSEDLGTESGTGTVSESGIVRLDGDTHPVPENVRVSYKASYSGRLSNPAATLRGTQDWQIRGEPYLRHCTVELERSK